MARKKNKKSGEQGGRKQNKSGGSQKSQGLGSGSVKQSAPSSQTVSLATKYGIKNTGSSGDIVVTGSEIVGVAASTNQGKIVFIADLNPVTWTGTRISRMVPLFETYLVVDLRVTYIPSCNTTTGGLLYMYYDRDPNDAPIPDVSTAASLTRLMSNQNAVAGQVWKPLVMTYKPTSSEKAYYSAPIDDSGDLRLTSQGLVYAYSSAQSLAAAGGLFKFDYNIKLMTPTGPTAVINTSGPWMFSPVNMTGFAGTEAVVPNIIGGANPNDPSVSEKIFEVLLEYTYSVMVDGIARNLNAYTPLYMRYLAGAWRTYLALNQAFAWTSDYAMGPTTTISGNGWSRILFNTIAVAAGETT